MAKHIHLIFKFDIKLFGFRNERRIFLFTNGDIDQPFDFGLAFIFLAIVSTRQVQVQMQCKKNYRI